MSADNDLLCAPAPAPTPPQAPPESSIKTEVNMRAGDGPSKTWGVSIVLMVLALLAGVVFYVVARRSPDGAATATTGAVTGGKGSAGTVAEANGSDQTPAECVGDIADANIRWYCTQFLPFAKKASADHDRLDRLEAQGGGSGVPLGLWVIVIGIGVLTVYNTMRIHAKPKDKPSDG